MSGGVAEVRAGASAEVEALASALTWPRPGECLACYLERMMRFGCRGLRWSTRYRDLVAPRATGLERRLADLGGHCDCEVLMNAYVPLASLVDPASGPRLPVCRGVRRGSTQPCRLWTKRPRLAGW